ncbi:hypothetical protein IEQ34_006349 [Dendrobium chrysotoxum]|uniref:RHOMBOID-like protein n=1 Tax=Dendrobium chrysotoxum TaxID=161865 RepID=A0AAV7HB29_DENCH|nr:hypothetical protein IEQ34_006349 [Dendrobium chrysotoxum]
MCVSLSFTGSVADFPTAVGTERAIFLTSSSPSAAERRWNLLPLRCGEIPAKLFKNEMNNITGGRKVVTTHAKHKYTTDVRVSGSARAEEMASARARETSEISERGAAGLGVARSRGEGSEPGEDFAWASSRERRGMANCLRIGGNGGSSCEKRERRSKGVSRTGGSDEAREFRQLPEERSSENLLLLELEKLGALVWDKVVNQHEGWRLITCIWLHAGVIHLLANMLSLVFIGIRLEQQFGFVRISIIYLLSGFGGSILSSLFIRNSISVGASGALFGLLGAILSELITNWTIYSNKAASLLTLLLIIAINLAVGILPHVDNFAHIGGFVTGFLLGFVLLLRPQFGWVERHNLPAESLVKSKHKDYQYVLCVIALLLLISGFTVSLVLLFRGVNGNDHCKWCHYISCVPTSKWSCGN